MTYCRHWPDYGNSRAYAEYRDRKVREIRERTERNQEHWNRVRLSESARG